MTSFTFEANGKIQMPSDEELAAADADSAILAFTHGTMQDGRPFWAYVAVKPSKYKTFAAISAAKGQMIIEQYGEVLHAGYGTDVPAKIAQEMRDKYGWDDEYNDNLIREAKAQQGEFLKKQEEKRINDIVLMLKRKNSGNTDG